MVRFYRYFIFILLSVSFLCCKKEGGVLIKPLADWQFRKSGESVWLQATVPGCVHTDLLKNGKVDDPYFGNNEQKLHWIEKENWEYSSVFEIEKRPPRQGKNRSGF